jgi:Leu/Phe-tRNA-protein transferase
MLGDDPFLRLEQLNTFTVRGVRFLSIGYVFIDPADDPNIVMDRIIALGYRQESCYAVDFSPEFIARLMSAGFLVMSRQVRLSDTDPAHYFIVEPMHHLRRSFLFFENLHEKRSARLRLNSYELRVDSDFDAIVDKCVAIHGSGWLTPPLVEAIKKIRVGGRTEDTLVTGGSQAAGYSPVKPVSFGLYRKGALVAGEFGTVIGGVYTSYSGYHEENDAGNVQLILTARYLRDSGFAFWDLGMPLPYKAQLGARTLPLTRFLPLWRDAIVTHPVFM